MATKTENGTAARYIPARPTLPKLRDAAAGCKACPLWKTGTQTVFGEGIKKARLILVGEQPGDQEDLQGRPFVGPAGRILDKALDEAGIDRKDAYVTNVVKHFKWEPSGKRRLHKKPNMTEVTACFPWLAAEVDVIKPEVVVALGATATQALFGKDVKVMKDRGQLLDSDLAPHAIVTVHPSSILRKRDDRDAAMADFVADLRVAAKALNGK